MVDQSSGRLVRQIRIDFQGARGLSLDAEGDLVIDTASGPMRQRRPAVYQEIAGARRVSARVLDEIDLPAALATGALVIEDAGEGTDERALFHMLNLMRQHEAFILMTAHTLPATWRVELADLASRLRAIPTVELRSPDDALLRAVNDPSLTVTVMLAVPIWFVTGVIVTVRVAPLPPKMTFPTGTSVGLDDVALSTRLDRAVSTSPTVKLIGPVEVFWLMVRSGILEIVGGSFTGVTVRTKLSLAVASPSLTVTVIVALPD